MGLAGSGSRRGLVKILVVDDDPQVLYLVSVGFQMQWQDCTVISATDGAMGMEQFAAHDPDVVVLDVGLPHKDGFEVLEEIRRISDVPVLMLTGRGEDLQQVRGLELGADDYITKPFGPLALLARVKAVLRRAELPPPASAEPGFVAGNLAIFFENQRATLRGETLRLTAVEYKLLAELAHNAGRVLPYRALLERVWGADGGITNEYLKVFISRLRAKLEPSGSQEHFIENVRGVGYRFVRPPAADA